MRNSNSPAPQTATHNQFGALWCLLCLIDSTHFDGRQYRPQEVWVNRQKEFSKRKAPYSYRHRAPRKPFSQTRPALRIFFSLRRLHEKNKPETVDVFGNGWNKAWPESTYFFVRSLLVQEKTTRFVVSSRGTQTIEGSTIERNLCLQKETIDTIYRR